MDVQKFSVLREWNVWMYQLPELEQCVDHVLRDMLKSHGSAMVELESGFSACSKFVHSQILMSVQ